MLRAAACLALTLCLTAAAPAGAQSGLRDLGGLRGAQAGPSASESAREPAAGRAPDRTDVPTTAGLGLSAEIVAPPPAPPALPALGYDSDHCRSTCARSYYFCLSTERADDCPGAWGQCRARCDTPSQASPG